MALTDGGRPAESRRDFLRGFVKYGFGLLAFLYGAAVLRFLYPARVTRRQLRYHPLLKEDDIPRQGVKRVHLAYHRGEKTITMRVFLVNTGADLFALSASCSHLGCLVDWSRHKEQFICPCHGGKYDMRGNVIDGPPPLPLSRMPLKIEDGMVYTGIKE